MGSRSGEAACAGVVLGWGAPSRIETHGEFLK